MEHKDMKNRLDSKLQIYFICSIRAHSRKTKNHIFEKQQQLISNPFVINFFSSATKAGKLADKWRKCLRRIPLRPKSAQDNMELAPDEKEQDEVKSRRRSPRLLPPPLQQNHNVIPELTEEEIKKREALREERRRQFEEQVKNI